jgi:hypothetical protein
VTPERCPGCGAKLEPEARDCPNCPMSFPEDDGPSEGNPLKNTGWYRFLPPLLLFGGIAAVVWSVAMGLFSLGEDNAKELDRMGLLPYASTAAVTAAVEHGDADAVVAGQARAQSASDAKKAAASDDGNGSGMISISEEDDGGPGEAPQAPPPAPAAPQPKPASEWRLRGTVYDLTTLKPLSGCLITFTDPQGSGRPVRTRTDAAGRYRVLVAALPDGYAAALSKTGFSPSYLNQQTESVKAMPADQRLGLARRLAATLGAAPLVVAGNPDGSVTVTDFYLAPRR